MAGRTSFSHKKRKTSMIKSSKMKNGKHPEYQYLSLGREILDAGIDQKDRGTGVVTRSVFGVRHEYDLSEDFPLLTSKLVDRNVHILDDYPHKIYREKNPKTKMTKDEFIEKIKNDSKFAKKWGELPR